MPIERLVIDLEFVTPCFLGGSDYKESAEWRAQSVRGLLRWWLRATAPGNLAEVSALESRLFGSTSGSSVVTVETLRRPAVTRGDANYGDSRLGAAYQTSWRGAATQAETERLTVRNRNPPRQEFRSNPVGYMGYGPIFQGGTHPRFEAGVRAQIRLQASPRRLATGDLDALGRALWCWINVGGIGSRSRRGFGSLRCVGASGAIAGVTLREESRESFSETLKAYFPPPAAPSASARPDWSRFSPSTRVVIGAGRNSWTDAVGDVGAWFVGFRRRYGSPGDARSFGGAAVANRDYVWAYKGPGGAPTNAQIPDRAGFGLPLAFRGANTVSWDTGRNTGEGRRASPLLVHIAKFGNQYHAVLTHLPGRFLPANLVMRGPRSQSVRAGATTEQEQIVTWFVDDLAAKGLVTQVWP